MADTRESFHTCQNPNSVYSEDRPFDANSRKLTNESPAEPYQGAAVNQDKTTVHWGRRQLLVNEIEFLSLAMESLLSGPEDKIKKKLIVVFYAGAAPGNHLLLLAEFFPFMKFVLVDPNPFEFNFGSKNFMANFTIRNDMFTLELAAQFLREYNDDDYIRLFMSDIRNVPTEPSIERDMSLQKEIHRVLEPFKSFLKFRPPYFNPKKKNQRFTYLDGEIYSLIWGRSHTSETRLIVDRNSKADRAYDHRHYENQMYYFNKCTRTNCYRHEIRVNGFDHCYDCRAEVFVLDKYCELHPRLVEFAGRLDQVDTVAACVDRINTGLEANIHPVKFTLNLNEELFDGKYIFTHLEHLRRYDNPEALRAIMVPTENRRNGRMNGDNNLEELIGGLDLNRS
jgi:hypothetical protein